MAPLSLSAFADAESVATTAHAGLFLPNESRKLGSGSLLTLRRPAIVGIISARPNKDRDREAA
jgi:hypothetical protein